MAGQVRCTPTYPHQGFSFRRLPPPRISAFIAWLIEKEPVISAGSF